MKRKNGMAGAILCGAVLAAPALAQRSNQNAVTSAGDAFGNSVGSESIGLYGASDVRGFSPIVAGNLRLEGLYFDQLDLLNARLFDRRVVRVGPSAQGYPFPAPTGIVDHFLREPGDKRIISVVTDVHSFGGGGVEIDAKIPLGATAGLAGGVSHRRIPDYPGGDYVDGSQAGVIGVWRPDQRIKLEAFAGRISFRGDRTTPFIFAAGPQLPPVLSRDYLGQKWAAWHTDLDNYGVMGSAQLGEWQLRAGLFRYQTFIERGFDVLFLDTDSSGVGRLVVNADPAQHWIYDSGELRLSRTIEAGNWRHIFHASVRDGERQRNYGGTDSRSFGRYSLANRPEVAAPVFTFGAQTRDETRQLATGLAYNAQWAGHGEAGFGVQKVRYRKSVMAPDRPSIDTKADPLLWNGTIAVNLGKSLDAYGGYTRGLEASEVAPGNAVNRNEAPPALLTSQRDLGLVLRVKPDLGFILGAFDVQKPYFNLDTARYFRQLGIVRHRGVEFSASGTPLPGLSMVAGALLLRPRISGEAVSQGLIGEKPVGQAEHVLKLNLDYRLAAIEQVSVDMAVAYTGSRVVSVDNRMSEPGHSVVDAGARYRFHVDGSPATLRLLLANVADENGWSVSRNGGLRPIPPRSMALTLAVDF